MAAEHIAGVNEHRFGERVPKVVEIGELVEIDEPSSVGLGVELEGDIHELLDAGDEDVGPADFATFGDAVAAEVEEI